MLIYIDLYLTYLQVGSTSLEYFSADESVSGEPQVWSDLKTQISQTGSYRLLGTGSSGRHTIDHLEESSVRNCKSGGTPKVNVRHYPSLTYLCISRQAVPMAALYGLAKYGSSDEVCTVDTEFTVDGS